MKFLKKLWKPGAQESSVPGEPEYAPVGVRVRQKPGNEKDYSDDSTFSWFGVDHADSSIFESADEDIGEARNEEDATGDLLKPVGSSRRNADENEGFDPYNTGHFESSKTNKR